MKGTRKSKGANAAAWFRSNEQEQTAGLDPMGEGMGAMLLGCCLQALRLRVSSPGVKNRLSVTILAYDDDAVLSIYYSLMKFKSRFLFLVKNFGDFFF